MASLLGFKGDAIADAQEQVCKACLVIGNILSLANILGFFDFQQLCNLASCALALIMYYNVGSFMLCSTNMSGTNFSSRSGTNFSTWKIPQKSRSGSVREIFCK